MWFSRRTRSQVKWTDKSKDGLVADIADVACHPENWRSVVLVAVDSEGGTMITRYRGEDTSGMEALGSVRVAAKLLERTEVDGFER